MQLPESNTKSVFRTLLNIYDGDFSPNNERKPSSKLVIRSSSSSPIHAQTHLPFTCSNLDMETGEYVKFVQN